MPPPGAGCAGKARARKDYWQSPPVAAAVVSLPKVVQTMKDFRIIEAIPAEDAKPEGGEATP